MDWLFFALLPPALWATLNIMDKFFLTKYIKSPYSYQVIIALSNILILPVFPLVSEISFVYPWSLYSLIVGAFSFLTFILYNKAMKLEEPSRVSIMSNLTPIMTLFMAYFLLGERLFPLQYIGILAIISGAFLISYKKTKNKFKLSPAILIMLIFAINIAAYQIIAKYFFSEIDYFSYNFWNALGLFLSTFIFLMNKKIRKDFLNEPFKFDKGVWFWRFVGTYIYFAGLLSFYFAVDTGFVSLASVFTSTQSMFVIVYSCILSFFMPGAIEEEINKKTVLLKVISASLIILGAYLIII